MCKQELNNLWSILFGISIFVFNAFWFTIQSIIANGSIFGAATGVSFAFVMIAIVMLTFALTLALLLGAYFENKLEECIIDNGKRDCLDLLKQFRNRRNLLTTALSIAIASLGIAAGSTFFPFFGAVLLATSLALIASALALIVSLFTIWNKLKKCIS